MRKVMFFLCILFYSCAYCSYVLAVPMYYTFEGELNWASSYTPDTPVDQWEQQMEDVGELTWSPTSFDVTGFITPLGLSSGSVISYTFEIDLDADAYAIMYDGTTITGSDWGPDSNGNSVDYFSVNLISGPVMGSTDGPYPLEFSNGIYDNHWGNSAFYIFPDYENWVSFGVNSDNNPILFSNSDYASIYYEGSTGWQLNHRAFDSEGNMANLSGGNFSLVSISEDYIEPVTEPVPEPATMLLLGSGLVGLAGFSRKKFKK